MQLKQKLQSNERVLGTWLSISSSAVAEIMGKAGFDLVVVDLEHSTLSIADAGELIRVIDLSGSCPVVRVSSNDLVQIKRVLDAGAEGIIIPMITTAEEVQRASEAMLFPPRGRRGVGLGRAQAYGPGFKDYFETESQSLTLITQIEHIDAIANLDEIFGSGLVDGFIVGPYDLSCSLGVPGKFDHKEMVNALSEIRTCAERHGIPGGLHVVEPDVSGVKTGYQSGYRLMIYSVDFRILEKDVSRAVRDLR